MDQRSWPWKKKSTEVSSRAERVNSSLSRNEEVNEVQELLDEKAELERSLRISNEKLAAALADCNAKDIITKKQVKIAQEAIAGWEKADGEAMFLKKELDKAVFQKSACEERLGHLDAALKECMQQLRFVRDEQEKRVHGAVMKTSVEFEKSRMAVDEKLAETGKKLAKLEAENTQFRKSLSGKDKVIEELSKYRAEVEEDVNALMLRVESTEKENNSLKYEVRVLEKELEIRNEEREFIRQTADVASKQQQESVKKISKLESECQRLRLLVRKRLPGPAALAKMKNEVGMHGTDHFSTRRKSNPSLSSSMDSRADPVHDARISFVIEHLHKLEEENRSLKDALHTKSSFSRIEGQVGNSSKGHPIIEPGKFRGLLMESSAAAASEIGSDDKASCDDSWTSSYISELEQFKIEKRLGTPAHGNMGASELNLMDDFAEMEKIAVVSVDYPAGSSRHSSDDGNGTMDPSESPSHMHSEPLISSQDFRSKHEVSFDDILKMLVEYCQGLKRNPVEVLEDIKAAFVQNNLFNSEASDTGNSYNIASAKENAQKLHSDVSVSAQKILELLEGIITSSEDNGLQESCMEKDDKLLSYKSSDAPTGYMVRVFQWKSAELHAILKNFLKTCNDLLSGTADLEHFAQEVAVNLDWVMNHCFSIQDVSSMKDAIRNNLDWDESRSESEVDSGSINHSVESNRFLSPPRGHSSSRLEVIQADMNGDCKRLSVELTNKESSVADSEGRSHLESVNLIENLQKETEIAGPCEGQNGNGNENEEAGKMLAEDLDIRQLETDLEQRNVCKKISQLETELQNKNKHCERLEERCSDLKIQLESKETVDLENQGERQLENDREITAASEKLAECQETILNLGKQLKALATPKDAALSETAMSTTPTHTVASTMSTPTRNIDRMSSLLNKMLAEDNDQNFASSSRMKDDIQQRSSVTNPGMETWNKVTDAKEDNHNVVKSPAPSMAIGPYKKKSGGRSLFKRLFMRAKKGNSKKGASML